MISAKDPHAARMAEAPAISSQHAQSGVGLQIDL